MARIIMGNVLNVRKIFVRDVVLISLDAQTAHKALGHPMEHVYLAQRAIVCYAQHLLHNAGNAFLGSVSATKIVFLVREIVYNVKMEIHLHAQIAQWVTI